MKALTSSLEGEACGEGGTLGDSNGCCNQGSLEGAC